MAFIKYRSSAPGSLMLMGEHAVVYGRSALVCAVEPRIIVEINVRTDDRITIESEGFPSYQGVLSKLVIEKPYAFILAVLTHFQTQLTCGIDIRVFSDLSHHQGWGSSAAVTVAMLHVLGRYLQMNLSQHELLQIARAIILRVQGRGSASDAAASVYGGVIVYDPTTLNVEKVANDLPLSWVYSGAKIPTADVLARVAALRDRQSSIIDAVFNVMHDLVQAAKKSVQRQDWKNLGELMNIHQGLQDSLGVSTPLLNTLIDELRQHPAIAGAKISGSGLGDAVIGLGYIPDAYFPLSISQAQQGVLSKSVCIATEGVRDEA